MAETVIGALSVKITADTKGVKDGLKASGEALEIGGKQLRSSVNQWGKWALAATAAAAGVAAAIIKSNLSTIKELKNLSAAADEQVSAFQRGAFAANSVGISTEKYGDILKDVNDRVGDFMISGAGPMVDFFETIGPKIGITADAFKGLSGQESLGLYIKSLQEAGVSQQEMTFFMEALASDSIALAPLFQDNAKLFKALSDEAKDLGIGLSDIDVEKAAMASAEMAKTAGIIDSFTNQATAELVPIISAVTNLFVDMAKEAGGSTQFIQEGIDGLVTVVGVFANGLQGIEIIFKGLEIAALGFSALVVNVFAGTANVINDLINMFNKNINALIISSNLFLKTNFDLVIPKVSDDSFIKSINEVADNMTDMVMKANSELSELASAPLNSEEIKAFVSEAVGEYERLAAAKVNALSSSKLKGEGVGTKTTSEIEIFEAETIGLLEALSLRFLSQEEMQLAHLEKEAEQLNAARANGELTAIQHSEKMAEIKQNEEDLKRQITLQGVQKGFQALASGNEKVRKLMAAAATVQAIIKGKQAAVDAWQAGMSTGGPWAPAVAASYAAASLANTGSMIKSINSGGSSQGAISSGGFSGGATQDSAPTNNNTQSAPQQDRNITIRAIGQSFSGDVIRDIIEQINEQTDDGVQLNFSGG